MYIYIYIHIYIYLRAAAPAADPGRIGKEANRENTRALKDERVPEPRQKSA